MTVLAYTLATIYILLIFIKFIADGKYRTLLNQAYKYNDGVALSKAKSIYYSKPYRKLTVVTYSMGAITIITISSQVFL